MAGDWIKIELVTPDKPEIDMMAELLDVSVNEVIGGLVRVWIWADTQTLDGNARSVTKSAIDRHSGVTGLAQAMLNERVGWLVEMEDGGFCFPNFDRHNGQTAKSRALTAKRVANHKKRKGNADSVTNALPREEKRREERKYIAPSKPEQKKIGDELVVEWNKRAGQFPQLCEVKWLSQQRQDLLHAAFDEHPNYGDLVRRGIEKVPIGQQIGDGWQPTFDWMLQPANIHKLLEGHYDAKKKVVKPVDMQPVGPSGKQRRF